MGVALSMMRTWPLTLLKKGLLESTGIGVQGGAVNEADADVAVGRDELQHVRINAAAEVEDVVHTIILSHGRPTMERNATQDSLVKASDCLTHYT